MTDGPNPRFIIPLLRLRQSPMVQVELHSGSYDTIERMLLDERAELGFVRMPVQKGELVETPLVQVNTVCVLPQDHPLAVESEIDVRDLSDEPLTLLGRLRVPRHEIDTLFFTVPDPPQCAAGSALRSVCLQYGRSLSWSHAGQRDDGARLCSHACGHPQAETEHHTLLRSDSACRHPLGGRCTDISRHDRYVSQTSLHHFADRPAYRAGAEP